MDSPAVPTDEAGVAGDQEAAPRPAPRRGNQYNLIQALRFLAAFAVVVLHSSFYTSERLGGNLGIYSLGANGVRLFFVISGFVMIMSSERLLDRARGWSVFAIKRILRIVPLYWAVNALKVAMMLASPAVVLHAKLDWGFVAKSFFFIPAVNIDGEMRPLLGVGWTLNFEMFFYALFTLALVLRLRPILFLAPILVALSIASLFKTGHWPVPAFFLANPIVLDFLAGMLIARWCQMERALPPGLSWGAVAAGLFYLFLPFPKPAYDSMAGSLATTFAAALVILGATSLEPRIGLRVPRWALFMGAASYSLYLLHPLLAPAAPQLLAKFGIGLPYLSIVFSIVLATIGGAACYLLVETTFSRLLDGVAKRSGLLDAGARLRDRRGSGDTGAVPASGGAPERHA